MSEDKCIAFKDVLKLGSINGRRQFRNRSLVLVIILTAVWLVVLVDPHIGPMALYIVGGFGVALATMAVAMGLGFLGFGIFAVGDWLVRWIHRTSQWPEE